MAKKKNHHSPRLRSVFVQLSRSHGVCVCECGSFHLSRQVCAPPRGARVWQKVAAGQWGVCVCVCVCVGAGRVLSHPERKGV